MWGRANMAVVILLLACACVFASEEAVSNPSDPSIDAEADAILERATAWLWSQRDKNAGWGNVSHQVLLALRLSNLTREDNVPPPPSLEMQLSAKEMEVEIVLLLWRHRDIGFSPVRLARYTLALNALCMDPRQFHGHDLIGTLQHHEPTDHYEFAVATLAVCSAQAHVRKRQIRRILYIAHSAQNHNIETVSMVILALRCIVQDQKHRNLHHFLRKPSVGLAKQQKHDGSFGDLRTTVLAMQALEEVENEPAENFNRSAALAWLANRQRPDGSFDGDVHTTVEAILGVVPRGLANVRTLDCGQGLMDSSPPRLVPSNVSDITAPDNQTDIWIPLTSGPNATAGFTESATNTLSPALVNVSYTLWVGSNVNETYNLTIIAPKNETFYDVMVQAAKMSPHFQFVAFGWPNGHYVHTLAGYKEEPMSYHYWQLYRLPSPPDPASPPDNQLVAPGGVDELQIGEGEHYLFWYKKL